MKIKRPIRAVIWKHPKFKGRTAKLIHFAPNYFKVAVDGIENTYYAMSYGDLYFPDHHDGYNQPCFQ